MLLFVFVEFVNSLKGIILSGVKSSNSQPSHQPGKKMVKKMREEQGVMINDDDGGCFCLFG